MTLLSKFLNSSLNNILEKISKKEKENKITA
jgi:hypothetical protein